MVSYDDSGSWAPLDTHDKCMLRRTRGTVASEFVTNSVLGEKGGSSNMDHSGSDLKTPVVWPQPPLREQNI